MVWSDTYDPTTYNVPLEWRKVVCTCHERTGIKFGEQHGQCHTALCNVCGLLKRYQCSRCADCGEFYVMNFIHTVVCRSANLCWDCCEDYETCPADPRHNHAPTEANDLREQKPYIFPEKKKSKEELAAAFKAMLESDFEIDY